jgi:hypothetical protein
MRVYGHVQWPMDTSEPVVYVVSGGCPSATWLAKDMMDSVGQWVYAVEMA